MEDKCTFVTGISGAGKSTHVDQYKNNPKYEVIHMDALLDKDDHTSKFFPLKHLALVELFYELVISDKHYVIEGTGKWVPKLLHGLAAVVSEVEIDWISPLPDLFGSIHVLKAEQALIDGAQQAHAWHLKVSKYTSEEIKKFNDKDRKLLSESIPFTNDALAKFRINEINPRFRESLELKGFREQESPNKMGYIGHPQRGSYEVKYFQDRQKANKLTAVMVDGLNYEDLAPAIIEFCDRATEDVSIHLQASDRSFGSVEMLKVEGTGGMAQFVIPHPAEAQEKFIKKEFYHVLK